MVLLCDGRLTCGCADPYGRRILGDTRTTSVSGGSVSWHLKVRNVDCAALSGVTAKLEKGASVAYQVGTMIELPRACLRAGEATRTGWRWYPDIRRPEYR